jgi:putative endonuclease
MCSVDGANGVRAPAVYLLASERNGTLYLGVTSNLVQRIWQHREGVAEGFTSRYGVKTLVWYEQHESMENAILREKAIKKWRRAWKLELIEKENPTWKDLWPDIVGLAENTPDTPVRHSRERGNPESSDAQPEVKALDSRVRGNDDGSAS